MRESEQAHGLSIKTLDPCVDSAWDGFVSESETSVFHTSRWMDVISRTYGVDFSAVVLIGEDGAVTAGIPYVALEDARSRRLVSLPFSDFCDPLVATEEEWSVLTSELLAFDSPVELRCMRSEFPMADPRFELAGVSLWHGVDLSDDLDEMWSALHRSARNKVRKAQREGIQVRTATDLADMREFFELHLRVRKYRHGLLAQPFHFFETLWHTLIEGSRGVLLLAAVDGRVIGGTVLLLWQDTMYYKYSAMDPDLMSLGTNDLLLWSAVAEGRERGFDAIDLGLSDPDQIGLVGFKRKFASREGEIRRFVYTPADADSARDEEFGELMNTATRLLASARVPDAVTEAAGDALYRYFA